MTIGNNARAIVERMRQGSATTASTPVTTRFQSIQYLRGLAAIAVLLHHLDGPIQRFGYQGHWPQWLSGGVDLFFVISGFVMWLTTAARPTTPLRFYRNRIIRIVPLYWLITTLLVVLLLAAPQLLQTARFDLLHIVASYVFIPVPHPSAGAMWPLLVPGWTLNYEMFFYAIFGVTLLIRNTGLRLAAITAVLVALSLYGIFREPTTPSAQFYTAPIIMEFIFGLFIAHALMTGIRIPYAAGILIVLCGTVLLPLLPLLGVDADRAWILGLPCALIVFGAVMAEVARPLPNSGALLAIGDASYSLYLVHGLAISAVTQGLLYLNVASMPYGTLLFTMLALSGATIAGLLVHWLIEVPLLSRLQARHVALRPA